MTNIEKLQLKIEELEEQKIEVLKQLNTLSSKRTSIVKELNELRNELETKQIKKMGIDVGSWFLSVNMKYSIFTLMKITQVNKCTVEYIEYTYQGADDDFSFDVDTQAMMKKELMEHFTFYYYRRISNEEAQKLIQIGLECKEDKLPDIQYLYD